MIIRLIYAPCHERHEKFCVGNAIKPAMVTADKKLTRHAADFFCKGLGCSFTFRILSRLYYSSDAGSKLVAGMSAEPKLDNGYFIQNLACMSVCVLFKSASLSCVLYSVSEKYKNLEYNSSNQSWAKAWPLPSPHTLPHLTNTMCRVLVNLHGVQLPVSVKK